MQECLMFCLLLVKQSTMMRAMREVIWRARKHLGETELTFDSLIKFVEKQLAAQEVLQLHMPHSIFL